MLHASIYSAAHAVYACQHGLHHNSTGRCSTAPVSPCTQRQRSNNHNRLSSGPSIRASCKCIAMVEMLVQLPRLVDSQKLHSEGQRILLKARQGTRQPAATAGTLAAESTQIAALLSWCQAVCSTYGLLVLNFRTSFADVMGLCLLVSKQALQSLALSLAICDNCYCLCLFALTLSAACESKSLVLSQMHV